MRIKKIGCINNIDGRIDLKIDDEDLDFQAAKDRAKEKAGDIRRSPLMLSWFNGKTGQFYPTFECGAG